MPLSDHEFRAIIERHLQSSDFSSDTERQSNQKAALDSYFQRNNLSLFGEDGLSVAKDTSVADMVEAVVAQMMPAFDVSMVAAYPPDNAADVEQAKVETHVCNTFLQDVNQGYVTIQGALRNALLLRNGILRIDTERRVDVSRTRLREVDPLAVELAAQPTAPGQTVEVINLAENDGDTVSATIKRTTENRELRIRAVDPTMFVLTQEWTDPDVQDAPTVGERFLFTRSELIQRGIPRAIVDELPSTNVDTTIAAQARNRDGTSPVIDTSGDRSMDRIECYELWLLVDYDQDGIAERRRVLTGGGTSAVRVLENELADLVPFATGTGFVVANRWQGMSLFDKLQELERQKTVALQQMENNMALCNNCEVIIQDGLVNEVDLKARRPGGINRADDINAVRELKFVNIVGESIAYLDYLDKQRSERGGASLDLQAAELQIAGDTAHGIERQYSAREQLAQLMTRTLGETLVRQLFVILHATLRRDFPQANPLGIQSNIVRPEPGAWPPRFRVDVVAGLTATERAEKQMALQMTLGQQEKLMSTGLGSGILTNIQTYYDTLIDFAMASGLRNPRRYYIDPRSEPSLEAQQIQQQNAQQAQVREQELRNQLLSQQINTELLKVQGKLAEGEQENALGYYKAVLDAVMKQLELAAQADKVTDEEQRAEALQAQGALRSVASE